MAKKKSTLVDLPQTVYVSRVMGTNGDSSFLSADENRDSLVDDEQEVTYVGKYELVDWQKLAYTVEEVK